MLASIEREKLFILHKGICLWCKCNTRLFIKRKKRDPQSDDSATIDHLINKSCRPHRMECVKVLACYKCNNRRSKEENGHKPESRLTEEKLNKLIAIYLEWKNKQ